MRYDVRGHHGIADWLEGDASLSRYDGYWGMGKPGPSGPTLTGCVIWAGRAYVPLEPHTALDTFRVRAASFSQRYRQGGGEVLPRDGAQHGLLVLIVCHCHIAYKWPPSIPRVLSVMCAELAATDFRPSWSLLACWHGRRADCMCQPHACIQLAPCMHASGGFLAVSWRAPCVWLQWDALSIAHALLMEVAVVSSLLVSVFYWLWLTGAQHGAVEADADNYMKHAGNLAVVLAQVVLTRLPVVSYHYTVRPRMRMH